MVLGMGSTYIMVKTRNLLYVMFFHAFNNLIGILPVLLSGVSGISSEATSLGMNPIMLIGIIIAFSSVGIIFLRLGIRRLNDQNAGGSGMFRRIIFNVIFIIVMIAGFIIVGIGTDQTVFETNITMTIEEEYVL